MTSRFINRTLINEIIAKIFTFKVKTRALNDEEKKNVEISTEYLPLEQEDASNPVVGEKIEMLEEFERRKRARMINVSTDDSEIKKDLR